MSLDLARQVQKETTCSTPPGTPVTAILSAIALEVQELAALSDRLQPFISGALVMDGRRNGDHLREFQALDLLAQRLHGVSCFVSGLAERAPAPWRIDADGAASNVMLADLAHRLKATQALGASRDDATSAAGDFELFG